MKIVSRLFLGLLFLIVAGYIPACEDDESDCEKLWDKLNSCCDWGDEGGPTKDVFFDSCEERAEDDPEYFEETVDDVLSPGCDEAEYFCDGPPS